MLQYLNHANSEEATGSPLKKNEAEGLKEI